MPSVSFDWDQGADQLTRYTGGWQPVLGTPVAISYAYRETANAPDEPPPVPPGSWIKGIPNNAGGFLQFTAAQIAVMEVAISLIEDVANVTFNRVGTGTSGPGAYSDNADTLIGNFSTGTLTTQVDGWGEWWWWPDGSGGLYRAGMAYFNANSAYVTAPTLENAGLWLYLHEMMHTIGISHPGDYDATDGTAPTYADDAEYFEDTVQYTVMSYFSEQNSGANYGVYAPMTLMLHDIAAIQLLFGANMNARTGATTYGFHSNTGIDSYTFDSASDARVFTIWDAGGKDTLDFSGFTGHCVIDLRQEHFSSAGRYDATHLMIDNIAIARGVIIENAAGGSANDTINGNTAANNLQGNGGADMINGFGGNDTLGGGVGADKLIGSTGGDILNGGAGIDTLTGGAGADKFLLSAAPIATNRDVITDFNVADDTIGLDDAVFSGLGPLGNLAAGSFHIGPSAHDSDDRIIYRAATGALYYDPDGLGGAAQVQIATLTDHLALTNADFVIY